MRGNYQIFDLKKSKIVNQYDEKLKCNLRTKTTKHQHYINANMILEEIQQKSIISNAQNPC